MFTRASMLTRPNARAVLRAPRIVRQMSTAAPQTFTPDWASVGGGAVIAAAFVAYSKGGSVHEEHANEHAAKKASGLTEKRIQELGYTLPTMPKPLASYVPFVKSGKTVFLSGMLLCMLRRQ